MNQYEAMYLFDPTFGTSFEDCQKEVERLMERAEAELLFCRKWDERRLAFKVKGRKRGVYVLTYFKAAPDKIAPLERDVRLSDSILRALVLRADGVTPEMMERAIAAQGAAMEGEGSDEDRESSDREERRPRRSESAAPRSETSSEASEAGSRQEEAGVSD